MTAAAGGKVDSRGGLTPPGERDVAEEWLETADCRLAVPEEVAA